MEKEYDSSYEILIDILNKIRENNGKEPSSSDYSSIYSIVVDILKEYEIEGNFESIYDMVLAIKDKIS